MLKALLKRDNKRDHYAYLPSGSFQYSDRTVSLQAFFMQTKEVTNLEYRTFLNDLLIQGNIEEYLKAKPDEQMWVKQFDQGMKPMSDLYFSHPAYNNYPVVNISRQGAEMYCNWLTKAFNSYAIAKNAPQIHDVRLPSRTEWTYAASSCGKYTNYPWPGEFVRDSKGLFLANHKPFDGKFMDDGIFHTGHVTSYNPSEFGLYCLSGNVAEMVYNSNNERTQHGTAGGDWTSDAEHIKLYAEDLNNGITEPRSNIGFRVVFTHLGRL
jgi:formylglycine-generating enzyme required for sulfatase activity